MLKVLSGNRFFLVFKYADHESDGYLADFDLEFDSLFQVFFYLPCVKRVGLT